jgi:hypothetical protein
MSLRALLHSCPPAWLTSGPTPALPVPLVTRVATGLLIQASGAETFPHAPTILLSYGTPDRATLDALQRLQVDQIHWAAQGDEQYLWLRLENGEFCGLPLPDHVLPPVNRFWYLQVVVQQELYWYCRTFQVDHEGEVLHDTGLRCRSAVDCFLGNPTPVLH